MAEDRPDLTDPIVYQIAVDTLAGMYLDSQPYLTPSEATGHARQFVDETMQVTDRNANWFTVEYVWRREALTALARGQARTAASHVTQMLSERSRAPNLPTIAESRSTLAARIGDLSSTGDGLGPTDAAVRQFGLALLRMDEELDGSNQPADRELAAHTVDTFEALTRRGESIQRQLTHGADGSWFVEFLTRTAVAMGELGGDARPDVAALPWLFTRNNREPHAGAQGVRRALRGIRTGGAEPLGVVRHPPEPQPVIWTELIDSARELRDTVLGTSTPQYGIDLMVERARARWATPGLTDALSHLRVAFSALDHDARQAQELAQRGRSAADMVVKVVAEILMRDTPPPREPGRQRGTDVGPPTTPVDGPGELPYNIPAVMGLYYLQTPGDLPLAPEPGEQRQADCAALLRRWGAAVNAYRTWAAAAPQGSTNQLTRDGDAIRGEILRLALISDENVSASFELTAPRLLRAQAKADEAADIQRTGARVYEVGVSLGVMSGQAAREAAEQQVAQLSSDDTARGQVPRQAVSKAFRDLGPSPADAPADQRWQAWALVQTARLLNTPQFSAAWRDWAQRVAHETTLLRTMNGPGVAAAPGQAGLLGINRITQAPEPTRPGQDTGGPGQPHGRPVERQQPPHKRDFGPETGAY